MAKMLVPALTLPVRGATLFVATMPVPASPSGGQNGMPGCSVPVGSSRFAPSTVSIPASSPAGKTVGNSLTRSTGQPCLSASALNFASIAASYPPVVLSIGNMPLASPSPSTLRPVSCQCT